MLIAVSLFAVGDIIVCDDEGTMLKFSHCFLGALYYASQNFTSMQTAAVVRAVFIKTPKKFAKKSKSVEMLKKKKCDGPAQQTAADAAPSGRRLETE